MHLHGNVNIKSFRSLMVNGTQDTIPLHTNKGLIGYRIVKFQIMSPDSSENIESTVKVYKVEQATIDDDINFSDNTLLAAGVITQSATGQNYPEDQTIIFDSEIFNQDIYVTLSGGDYSASINYYIELEQVILDVSESTVATLKDIRNIGSQ